MTRPGGLRRRRTASVAIAVVIGAATLAGCSGDESGDADAGLVHQPRQRGSGHVGAAVLRGVRRRLQHRDADPAERGRRPARAAGAPPGRQRLVGRPHEPGSAVRGRVRQRRLPPADHRPGRRRGADGRGPRRPAGDRLLGRRAGGHALLGQHPAALVPALGGRGRRDRPRSRGLHLGGDDRGRRGRGRSHRRAGPSLRGLHGLDQRVGRLGRRHDHRGRRCRRRRGPVDGGRGRGPGGRRRRPAGQLLGCGCRHHHRR